MVGGVSRGWVGLHACGGREVVGSSMNQSSILSGGNQTELVYIINTRHVFYYTHTIDSSIIVHAQQEAK